MHVESCNRAIAKQALAQLEQNSHASTVQSPQVDGNLL